MNKLKARTQIDLACIVLGLVLFAIVPFLAHEQASVLPCTTAQTGTVTSLCVKTISTTVAAISATGPSGRTLQVTTSDPALSPFALPEGLLHTPLHKGSRLNVEAIGNHVVQIALNGSKVGIGAPPVSSTYGRLLLVSLLLLFLGLYDLSRRYRGNPRNANRRPQHLDTWTR